MTTPPVITAASELLDCGLSVVPLVTGTKRAACEWKHLQTQLMDPEELANWIPRYGTGVGLGIITGELSGVVVVEGDTADAVAWIEANLPYTPRKVKTKRGMHFYYRHPGRPVKTCAGEMAEHVDVRGDGGLVAAPPTSGRKWVLESGSDWADLPIFEAPTVRKGRGNLAAIDFTAYREARMEGAGAIGHSLAEGGRNASLAKIAGQLFRANHSFEEVLDTCSAINQTNRPPMPDREVFTTVNSIFMAEQRRRAADDVSNTTGPASVVAVPQPGIQFPGWVLNPGGVLGAMMAYAEQSSPHYHPVFALGAAIVTLGGVMGGTFKTSSNLRANLYLMACGPSGTGKEAARQAMVRALRASTLSAKIGPESFISPPAILKRLQTNRTCIAFLDEFGHQIRAARKDGSHAAGNLAMMTKLFSYAGSQYMGDDYASAERQSIVIDQPHLCIYATSVPGRIFDNLTPDDVTDGFLPRWLIWEVDVDKQPRRKDLDDTVPEALVQWLRYLGEMEASEAVAKPLVCPTTVQADAILDAWEEECRQAGNRHRHDNPMRVGLYNRGYEHAAKLAMIRAVSDGLGQQAITEEHARWAVYVVKSTIEANLSSVEDRVAVNDWERNVQKIQAAIFKAGLHGLTRRDVCRIGKGLRTDEADAVLDVLRARCEIEQWQPGPVAGHKAQPRFRKAGVGSVGEVSEAISDR